MPNGGSDCCGTCWFNAKNKGEAGYTHAGDPEPDFCIIRNLAIEDPFYTYCANHPHRNPDKITIPLGPVFTGDSAGSRQVWMQSPDTEEVRAKLLELLKRIREQPDTEYPMGIYLDELVIWQLGEFREQRAVDDLKRIAAFNSDASESHFGRSRAQTITFANEAVQKILHAP